MFNIAISLHNLSLYLSLSTIHLTVKTEAFLSSFHVNRILLINKERFPKWFPMVEFAEISRKLAEKREPAMYGNELKMVLA